MSVDVWLWQEGKDHHRLELTWEVYVREEKGHRALASGEVPVAEEKAEYRRDLSYI